MPLALPVFGDNIAVVNAFNDAVDRETERVANFRALFGGMRPRDGGIGHPFGPARTGDLAILAMIILAINYLSI